MKDKSDAYV